MKKLLFLFLILPIININTASPAQLDQLAGIGPVMAQRIIEARPFSSVDDLDKVKGIGPATLKKIKTQGFACIDCQAPVLSSLSSAPVASSISNSKTPTKAILTLSGPKDLPKEEKSVNNKENKNNPWFLFSAVLSAAIILSIFVLIIKIKFLKTHVRT
jgi:competence ComEA-like helix-hairpin-helix protein